jgi:uncharacterized membrane protein (UPF0127 family)
MRKILLATSLFIILIIIGIFYNFLFQKENLNKIQVGNAVFEIEIADTSLKQSRGLSGRENLEENKGMLFVFDKPEIRGFWMKGMKFPLDILWICGEKVIGFVENAPPAISEDAPVYYPPKAVDKVLEINAGLVEKIGIRLEDKALLR